MVLYHIWQKNYSKECVLGNETNNGNVILKVITLN